MVRGARWLLVLGLLAATLWSGVSRQANGEAAAAACQTFPETGRQVCEPFLSYWQQHGGLAQQGLPLSDAFNETNPTNGRVYLTQYFERARFEDHPESVDPQYRVLLGLLGSEQFRAKYPGGRPATPASGEGCFPETGRCVEPRFLDYWLAHGGLAQQGLPISDAFDELSPTDGKTYRVLLGLLGREQFLAKYPNGIPTGSGVSPAPSASPTATVPVPQPSAAPTATATPRPPTATPVPPTATPPTRPATDPRAGCDPSYPTICLPPAPPDLDCKDIPYRNFPVRKPDPHRLDSDNDGIGCES